MPYQLNVPLLNYTVRVLLSIKTLLGSDWKRGISRSRRVEHDKSWVDDCGVQHFKVCVADTLSVEYVSLQEKTTLNGKKCSNKPAERKPSVETDYVEVGLLLADRCECTALSSGKAAVTDYGGL